MIALEDIAPGFENTGLASQTVFRSVLGALSEPGSVHTLNCPMGFKDTSRSAALQILLALCDSDVTLKLQSNPTNQSDPSSASSAQTLERYLSFHTGVKFTTHTAHAQFYWVTEEASHAPHDLLTQLNAGTHEYPNESCTLILQVQDLESNNPHDGITCTGPGIASQRCIAVSGVSKGFWEERVKMQDRFPLGIDILFASGNAFMAIPRSTRITF